MKFVSFLHGNKLIMCSISGIYGYDVEPGYFGELLAEMHENGNSRWSWGSGFYGQCGRDAKLSMSTRKSSKEQVQRELWEFLPLTSRIVGEVIGYSQCRWWTSGFMEKEENWGLQFSDDQKRSVRTGIYGWQPMLREKSRISSLLMFNGTCPNHQDWSEEYLGSRPEPSQVDTISIHSIIRKRLYELNEQGWWMTTLSDEVQWAVDFIMRHAQWWHSIIWSVTDHKRDEILHCAFRWSNWNRPLVYGSNGKNVFWVASESSVLPTWVDYEWTVKPGEMIVTSRDWFEKYQLMKGIEYLCALEILYLLNRNSIVQTTIGPKFVYEIRENMWDALWWVFHEKYPNIKPDFVLGVPNGGLDFANGFEKACGLKKGENDPKIIRNHLDRSYISESPEECLLLILKKFGLESPDQLRWKVVVLIDDTIIKGDTMIYGILPMLRRYKATIYIATPSDIIDKRDDRWAYINDKKLASRLPDGTPIDEDDIFEYLWAHGGVFMPKKVMIESSMMWRLHTGMMR